MNPQLLAESATAMQTILTQIIHSSHALSTDDPDVLADIGGREGGRLGSAIADFFAALPGLANACCLVTDGDMGPVVAVERLASAAHEMALRDANHLRVMGRGYVGRESERSRKELEAIPHLSAAISRLREGRK